jgi:hypothetical protein
MSSVAGRRLDFLSWIVVAVAATGCAGGGTTQSYSSAPAPAWANDLCNAYGLHLNRTSATASATTAGAIADSLRAAGLKPTLWGSLVRSAPVARCDFQANAVTTPTSLVRCPYDQVAVVPDPTLYFWIDAYGHRAAIPDAVLGAPCDRTLTAP